MGGACGIGLATATGLQRFGARVLIGDIDQSAVKEAGTRLALEFGKPWQRHPLLGDSADLDEIPKWTKYRDDCRRRTCGGLAHARLPLLHECALGFRRSSTVGCLCTANGFGGTEVSPPIYNRKYVRLRSAGY